MTFLSLRRDVVMVSVYLDSRMNKHTFAVFKVVLCELRPVETVGSSVWFSDLCVFVADLPSYYQEPLQRLVEADDWSAFILCVAFSLSHDR